LISCLLTLVVVGVLMQKLIHRQARREDQP